MSVLEHYAREVAGYATRYHLRVEPDGSGLLLANATSAVLLSPAGVFLAKRLLAGASTEAVAREASRAFSGADRDQIIADARDLAETLEVMIRRGGGFVLRDLDASGASAFRRTMSAPLSAEVELGENPEHELLRHLWQGGVPQAVGVVTNHIQPEILKGWVEHAEDLGMITGVRAAAGEISLESLDGAANSGLDHIDLYYAGQHHNDWYGHGGREATERLWRRANELELFTMAVVPITDGTLDDIEEIFEAVRDCGVGALTAFACVGNEGGLSAEAMPQAATTAEESAEALDLDLTWAPPLMTSDVEHEVLAGPRVSNHTAVRVRHNGDVVPPTGPAAAAGNLLRESWATIWAHDEFRMFRESVDDPDRCQQCPGLSLCVGGCPGRETSWSIVEDQS